MTFTKRKATMAVSAAAIAGIFVMTMLFIPTHATASIQSTTQIKNVDQIIPAKPVSSAILSSEDLQLSMPAAFVPVTPQQAYADEDSDHVHGVVHNITLVAVEKTIQLPLVVGPSGNLPMGPATQVIAYTFNGTIPGPTIRVNQGDYINVTVIDPVTNTDNHGVDNHAAIISAVPNFLPTAPGTTKHYLFQATEPGLFLYHCEGNVDDLAEHVFRGMQGGVIVDPRDGYKTGPAKDIFLDFSEYYLANTGDFDWTAMFNNQPTYTWMNGIPFGYQVLGPTTYPSGSGAPLPPFSTVGLPSVVGAVPLHFNVGDHIRFFLLNAGDTLINYHLVGQQLQRVDQGGAIQENVQTFNLGGSNSAIADVTFNQPGAYVIVDHNYAQLFKGRVAVILVDNSSPNNSNPSNAVPPMGRDSLPQGPPLQYAFGTPLPASCLIDNSGTWTISSASSCNDQKPQSNGGTVDTNSNNQ